MFKFRFLLILILFFSFSYSDGAESNYYEILDVSAQSSQKEIQKAYKNQALKYHPDRNNENSGKITEKMTEINGAYEVLKDPKKREKYDRYLKGEEGFSKADTVNEKQNFYDFSEASKSFKNNLDKKPFDQDNSKNSQSGESPYLKNKTFQLFKVILLNMIFFKEAETNQTNPKLRKKQEKVAEVALKEILKEEGILNLNGTSRKRILQDFYQHFPKEKVKELIADKGGQKVLQNAFLKFIETIKKWYEVQNITGKERKAIEIFRRFSFLNQDRIELLANEERHLELLRKNREKKLTMEEKSELKAFKKQARKDLRVFKDILSALGLPSEVYTSTTLRSYLDGLKETLTKNLPDRKYLLPDHSNNKKQNTKIYIKDADVINVFKNIKVGFDDSHYNNLKAMSKTFNTNFLKSFPAQFIIFQAVIGASIYRQRMTDPYIYGAERNPEMLTNTMSQTLSPSGFLSFAIFIAVSQQVSYRLYGLGRSVDGRVFKTPFGNISFNGKLGRSVAPGTGLAAGFFISSIFDEWIRDENLLPCAKQQFNFSSDDDNSNILRPHIDPCEALYLNWGSSEKWKHYAVDAGALLGSGWLSHKLFRYSLMLIRSKAISSIGLLRAAGKFIGFKGSGWIGFFVSMYYFTEIHKIVDEYIGQPLKEQLTAGSIKNNIIDFTNQLENDFSDLSLYADFANNSDQHQNLFREKISSTEQNIKQIGHKFQHWTNVRSQHYSQSAYLWTKQLNRLLLPYEGSSKLLKDIFINSHFHYGLGVNTKHIWDWDSDKEINNEDRDWDRFNTAMEFSSKDSSDPKYQYQKNILKRYCSKVAERAYFSQWNQFCTNSQFAAITDEDNMQLFYETAFLIYEHLTDFPEDLKGKKENNFDFMPYLGRGLNEIFSSDPHYSIKKLSGEERFQLSKALIKAGLYGDNRLSHFTAGEILKFKEILCANRYPNYKTDEEESELYSYCYNPTQNLTQIELYCSNYKTEDDDGPYKSCWNFFHSGEDFLSWKIGNKFLSAGIYLLKEVLNDIRRRTSLTEYPGKELKRDSIYYLISNTYTPSKNYIQPLIDLLNVHKKGEKYFLSAEKYLKTIKEHIGSEEFKELSSTSNPYLFAKKLVCGGNKNESSDNFFVVPQFFSNSEISIYDFRSDQFVSLKSACEKLNFFFDTSKFFDESSEDWQKYFHDILFNQPVQSQGKNHENLYLVLEAILKEGHSSSKKLAQGFQNISQEQLKRIGDHLANQLEDITDNYYKNMINFDSEMNRNSDFQDFTSYYHKQKVLFDIRSFTGGGIKGLEISLFQVNYWMNTLKEFLALGDQNKFNQELSFNWKGFDQRAFEKAQFEVLSLLQSYHDSYQKEQGPYLLFPDKNFIKELNKTFYKEGKEGLAELYGNTNSFVILQKEYSNSPLPILMSSDNILSYILSSSIPSWNNPGQMAVLNSNPKNSNRGWEKLIYSVVFDLNKSLSSFFSQLRDLKTKESFENQLPSSDTH